MSKREGFFITLEGIDYAGKDTQAPKIKKWLEGLGFVVRVIHEPSKTSPIGRKIRKILEGKKSKPDDFFDFQGMYVEDRKRDIEKFIIPGLKRGEVCLVIRYGFSTIAYGTVTSGAPPERFIEMHHEIIGSSLIRPDLTLIIDISGEESARRMVEAKKNPELFEKNRGRLEKIRQAYRGLVNHPEFKGRIVVVNGRKPKEVVFEEIKKIILSRIPLPLPKKKRRK